MNPYFFFKWCFGLAHRWLAFFRNYVHLFRIIAANVRTAAVYPRTGDSPEFRPRPLMRVMDGCVLLAVVFALIRSDFTRYEALNRFTCPFATFRA